MNTGDQDPRAELTDEQLDALLENADQELLDYITSRTDPTATLAAIMASSEPAITDHWHGPGGPTLIARRSATIARHLNSGGDVVLLTSSRDRDATGRTDLEEQPTASARLTISLRPTQIEGIAEGVVLADAFTIILGMIGMGTIGILGAFLTLYVAAPHATGWFLGLAFAELALALAGILLISRRIRRPE